VRPYTRVLCDCTDHGRAKENPAPVFHPEFGRFMLEATPGKPWGIGFKDLLDVEPNMKWR
jgi:glutamate--cysteine ligase catalytic subunit